MHVQFYFRSSANFSRAFWPPGAGPSPVQVADIFISLRQTQKKPFCLLLKLILIFCFTFTTCELCLYLLNWVFQLKMSWTLSTYARKQKAQRWLQVDGEMQIAKSRHSKIFSVRSGIEMSMMRRQTEIGIVPSSRTHKEIPVSAAVTSTAPKLPDVACKKTVVEVRTCELSFRT